MNIGIVTIYDGNNMGSFLQAVALKNALEDLDHSVCFIERMTEEENLDLFLNRPFSKPRSFPMNHLARMKRFVFDRKTDENRREEIRKIYSVLRKDREDLPKLKPSDLSDIDLIICGSDEIWNFNNTSISVPFYTCLDYGKKINKIAYAVSVGSSSVDDFRKHPEIIKAISDYRYIFPRDQHSKDVLEKILDKSLNIACDPTLLVDRKRLDICKNEIISGSYIMLYAYDLTKEEKIYLKRFSKEHNLPIISILHYSDIADKIIAESPYAFANIIKNASYCYTSTFHGTIFCTLFAKKFIYRSRRLKVKQVAEYMAVENREWISGSYDDFELLMEKTIDRNVVDQKLNEIRMKNTNTLKEVIDNANI